MTNNALLAPIGLALAWLLTGAVRRYALSTYLIDQPNARSSHAVPTPRGGGLAIVASFMILLLGMVVVGLISPQLGWFLASSAGVVAVVGFLDDRKPITARWRFITHAAVSAWALWLLNGVPPVPLFGTSIDLRWFGPPLAVVYLVWMINLCNFMDGIDGLAAIEAITVGLGGALCWRLATGFDAWPLMAAFAGSVAGFLVWNYPPARIFMGDVGSCFIGMVLGALSLWSAQEATQVFWCWFILLGCFMVDATTTLIRRVRRGEKFHEAHRSHAYQYASRVYRSHKVVSLAVGAINLVWLLPIALLVALRVLDGVVGTLIAYAPLVWLAFHYKAGDRASQGL